MELADEYLKRYKLSQKLPVVYSPIINNVLFLIKSDKEITKDNLFSCFANVLDSVEFQSPKSRTNDFTILTLTKKADNNNIFYNLTLHDRPRYVGSSDFTSQIINYCNLRDTVKWEWEENERGILNLVIGLKKQNYMPIPDSCKYAILIYWCIASFEKWFCLNLDRGILLAMNEVLSSDFDSKKIAHFESLISAKSGKFYNSIRYIANTFFGNEVIYSGWLGNLFKFDVDDLQKTIEKLP